MRLPDHPKAGMLWRALQRAHLSWLKKIIPEDFHQECALFLMGWTSEAVDADPKAFFRAASRHFYKVAVNYGFRRPKHAKHYVRQAERLEPLEGAEEDGYEKRAALEKWGSWGSQDPEDSFSREFRERLELCKRILLTSGDGTGRTDWQLFQGYLSGLNLNELAFLTLGEVDPKEVRKRLKGIIRRIREATGVDQNLPMPPMPKKGKVEFRQGFGAGMRPNPARWRRILIPQELSSKKIEEQFKVSRATAFRAKKRGWLALAEKQPTLA